MTAFLRTYLENTGRTPARLPVAGRLTVRLGVQPEGGAPTAVAEVLECVQLDLQERHRAK